MPLVKFDLHYVRICVILAFLAQWFSSTWRFLKLPLPIFFIFAIISLLMRTGSFISINFNSLHPRMICIKIEKNWPAGSEKDLLAFSDPVENKMKV
jgi:hypothetical protein